MEMRELYGEPAEASATWNIAYYTVTIQVNQQILIYSDTKWNSTETFCKMLTFARAASMIIYKFLIFYTLCFK